MPLSSPVAPLSQRELHKGGGGGGGVVVVVVVVVRGKKLAFGAHNSSTFYAQH